jgi:4'-phosphopantetheinyl transferase
VNLVETWIWPLTESGDADSLEALLSASERHRAARFRNPADRLTYVLAHAGMRTLLAHRLGRPPASLAFESAAGGKPYLRDFGDLQFNLSHSREHALFAIGPLALGVDLEQRVALCALPSLLAVIATADERTALESLPEACREDAFLRLWVRKEALLKAIGCGLSGGAEHYRVGCGRWSETGWQALGPFSADGPCWFGRHLPAPDGLDAAIVVAAEPRALPLLRHRVLPAHWLAAATPAGSLHPIAFVPDRVRGINPCTA